MNIGLLMVFLIFSVLFGVLVLVLLNKGVDSIVHRIE